METFKEVRDAQEFMVKAARGAFKTARYFCPGDKRHLKFVAINDLVKVNPKSATLIFDVTFADGYRLPELPEYFLDSFVY